MDRRCTTRFGIIEQVTRTKGKEKEMIEEKEHEGWKLKKELSLGDVLAIVIAMLSIMSVYFKVDTRLALLEADRIERREVITAHEQKAERKFELIDAKLDKLLEAIVGNNSNGNGKSNGKQ